MGVALGELDASLIAGREGAESQEAEPYDGQMRYVGCPHGMTPLKGGPAEGWRAVSAKTGEDDYIFTDLFYEGEIRAGGGGVSRRGGGA